MKSNPNFAAAMRTKWRYRFELLSALSRRGACLRRSLLHTETLVRASRRPASHRLLDA